MERARIAQDASNVIGEAAPFDNSRKALAFAMNAHQTRVPPPYMNQAMAEVPVKTKRAKQKALQKLRDAQTKAEEERAAGRRLAPGRWPASQLDKTHLAGYILHTLDALDRVHIVVLSVRLITPALPCNCGNPCCSGWRPVTRWVTAINELCELTKNRALVIANEGRIPGAPLKVGLSTQPELRRQIIKEWATRRPSTVMDLARRFNLSWKSVALHRGWITEWLDTQENNAWMELDALFDRTGITGPSE
jgi:hypothetical protein